MLNLTKHLNIPEPTKTNEFRGGLKVVRDNSDIATIIGRDASEKLKRTPPIFAEKLIVFHNPVIKWLHGCYKVVATGKGKSILG